MRFFIPGFIFVMYISSFDDASPKKTGEVEDSKLKIASKVGSGQAWTGLASSSTYTGIVL